MTTTDAALLCGLISVHADPDTISEMVCDALCLDAEQQRVIAAALAAVSGLREFEADKIRDKAWDEGYAEGHMDGAEDARDELDAAIDALKRRLRNVRLPQAEGTGE